MSDGWVIAGVIIAAVSAIIALLFGIVAWLQGRRNTTDIARLTGADARVVTVTTQNSLPAYDTSNGGSELRGWWIGTVVTNPGEQRVRIKSWGIRCGKGNRNLFVTQRMNIDPALPYWLEPGDQIILHIDKEDVDRTKRQEGLEYDDMVPWVTTGDGRTFFADGGLPVKDE